MQHVPEGRLAAPRSDPKPRRLGEDSSRFGVESKFSSLDEAIDRIAFDAVIITTPTFTHQGTGDDRGCPREAYLLRETDGAND